MFGKNKVDLQVVCNKCGHTHNIRWKQIKIIPVGYKGNMRCYIECKNCNTHITIPHNKISKKAMRRLKFRYYF